MQDRLRHARRYHEGCQHQSGKQQIDGGPGKTVGKDERPSPGHDKRDAKADDVNTRARPHFELFEGVGAVCVNRDVLSGAEKRDHKRIDCQKLECFSRPPECRRGKSHGKSQLGNEDPPFAAAEKRKGKSVDQWRP